MNNALYDYWWVPVARGIAAIVLGVLTFVWPGLSVLVFVAMLAAYWIIDGAFSIYYAVKWKHWGWPFWGGLISIIAGLLGLFQPGLAALSIVLVIAVWALLRGALDIYTAIALRKQISFEWWLGLSGLAAIVFGGLVLAQPAVGAIAIVTLLGAFAIVLGVFLVISGLRIRRLRDRGDAVPT